MDSPVWSGMQGACHAIVGAARKAVSACKFLQKAACFGSLQRREAAESALAFSLGPLADDWNALTVDCWPSRRALASACRMRVVRPQSSQIPIGSRPLNPLVAGVRTFRAGGPPSRYRYLRQFAFSPPAGWRPVDRAPSPPRLRVRSVFPEPVMARGMWSPAPLLSSVAGVHARLRQSRRSYRYRICPPVGSRLSSLCQRSTLLQNLKLQRARHPPINWCGL